MRKKLPKHFDRRIITGFLFFPKTIGYEERWLEKVTWIEEYRGDLGCDGWVRIEWINSPII